MRERGNTTKLQDSKCGRVQELMHLKLMLRWLNYIGSAAVSTMCHEQALATLTDNECEIHPV